MRKIFCTTVLMTMAMAATLFGDDVHVSTSDAMKAAVSKPTPEYSAIAKQMKVSGKVELEVTIAPDGNVEAVKVLTGNPLLSQSSVTTMKKWKFTPFTANGAPARAIATLSFDFKQ